MHKTNTMNFFCRSIRPLSTKLAELNIHSTGTEAADEDKYSRWNMEWKLFSTS